MHLLPYYDTLKILTILAISLKHEIIFAKVLQNVREKRNHDGYTRIYFRNSRRQGSTWLMKAMEIIKLDNTNFLCFKLFVCSPKC